MAKSKKKFLTMKSQVRRISIKCYEEQLPEGWEETKKKIIKIPGKDWVIVAIKHDSDFSGDDVWEPSKDKPHFHILVRCVNGSHPRVQEILKALGVVYRPDVDKSLWESHGVEAVEDWVAMVTYLLHLTDIAIKEGKHQYSLDQLVSNISSDEIQQIMEGYVHKIYATDLKLLDKEAYELGYALGDFDDFYRKLSFEVRNHSSMKTIRESFESGMRVKVSERLQVERLCVFIQGKSNVGKTYAVRGALEGKRYLITPPGTGKFDELKASTEAIIIDDDICPNLLNMTDNYICHAYKRQKGNPAWAGTYFIVTSNKTFEDWLDDCGIRKPEHIEAMKTRFFICSLGEYNGKKYLACQSACSRGTVEEQNRRREKFNSFKQKFEEIIQSYNPPKSSDELISIHSDEEAIILYQSEIEKLKAENTKLQKSYYKNEKQFEYNCYVIGLFSDSIEAIESHLLESSDEEIEIMNQLYAYEE